LSLNFIPEGRNFFTLDEELEAGLDGLGGIGWLELEPGPPTELNAAIKTSPFLIYLYN
jgi:hypothetical protein